MPLEPTRAPQQPHGESHRCSSLRLPPQLDNAPMSCGTSYGKRVVSWTITEPGEWHRNRFSMAWLEVSEREPWRGEPLWLHASRRPVDSTLAREPFTARARDLISAEVLPGIARYGFSRLWTELHRRAGRSDPEAVERARAAMEAQIRRAEAELEWHRLTAELHDMHADGLTTLEPLRTGMARTVAQRDERRVAVVPRYRGDSSVQPVVARVLVDGEQVGWVTDHGHLIPLEDVLRGTVA